MRTILIFVEKEPESGETRTDRGEYAPRPDVPHHRGVKEVEEGRRNREVRRQVSPFFVEKARHGGLGCVRGQEQCALEVVGTARAGERKGTLRQKETVLLEQFTLRTEGKRETGEQQEENPKTSRVTGSLRPKVVPTPHPVEEESETYRRDTLYFKT